MVTIMAAANPTPLDDLHNALAFGYSWATWSGRIGRHATYHGRYRFDRW
jgi:hypothetical protein